MTVGGVGPFGVPFRAQSIIGITETTMASKMISAKFKCITMTQSANDRLFDAHIMCDVTASDGTFISAWGVTTMGKIEQAYVGRLLGQTGVYAKRFIDDRRLINLAELVGHPIGEGTLTVPDLKPVIRIFAYVNTLAG